MSDAMQILKRLKQASIEGVVVTISGKRYLLVPALLSVMHDNPEGRDLLCLWNSNMAKQICALCYAPRSTCAKYPPTKEAAKKHMALLDIIRQDVIAIVADRK